MKHFLTTADKLVISGIETFPVAEIEVNLEYYNTPFGLFLPSSSSSIAFIRFLNVLDYGKKSTYLLAPNHIKRLCGHLLNNDGELELVVCSTTPYNDEDTRCIEVFSLPVDNVGVRYHSLYDAVKTATINRIIKDKKLSDAITWVNDKSGDHFLKPITLDIPEWVKTRKEQGMTEKLLNFTFVIAE